MPLFPLPPLVSTRWLADRIGRSELVLLDCSWYLAVTGRDAAAEFLTTHLPGAAYFDLDQASDPRSALPHMLPSAEAFARYAGGLGVSNASAVVLYDGSGSNLSAARAWWLFRAFGHAGVTILDGGLGKWRAEGRATESGEARLQPVSFIARADGQVADRAIVAARLADGMAQVVDMRAAGRYRGTDPEPRAGLDSGHMPGARNLPYTELVHADGTALSLEELRERLAAAGISPDRPIIASCGSGVTACTLLHALHRLGQEHGVLYDGSWTEWVTCGMPVERGG